MKPLTKSNVFTFFESTDNYNEGLKICRNLLPYQDPHETLHDIFIKLQTKDKGNTFPSDHKDAIFVLVVVIKNHKIDKQRRKLPREVPLDYALDYTEDASPDIIEKLDKLNELINKEEDFFTEEQMKLWRHLYKTHPVAVIAKAMRKSLPNIYALKGKMKEKIRGHFELLDLFE